MCVYVLMSLYNMVICVGRARVCMFLLTSGDSSLTAAISDHQSAQPPKAQGHLWTQTIFIFLSPFFLLFISVLILTCCHSLSSCHAVPFSLFILSVTSSVFPPHPPTQTLSTSHTVFYQLIPSFCSSSAGLV